jgi:hypothetical protein
MWQAVPLHGQGGCALLLQLVYDERCCIADVA